MVCWTALLAYPVKVKALTKVAGVKENFFVGYGLVTGLPGTGDRRSRITQQSLSTLMRTNGIKIAERFITTRNAAAVMVTASASGFLEKGDRIDVLVSSLGDARSLANGVLLPTALRAGNGTIYVVASGVLTLPAQTAAPTRAAIVSGGVIERNFISVAAAAADKQPILSYERREIVLKVKSTEWDQLALLRQTLTETFPALTIALTGAKTLSISQQDNAIFTAETILKLLNTEINIPAPRVVVIDQVAGIVVTGGEVEIDPVYISLREFALNISQPAVDTFFIDGANSFATAQAAEAAEPKLLFSTVAELLSELHSLKLDGYQIGSIFKALKKSGALNAELIFQ